MNDAALSLAVPGGALSAVLLGIALLAAVLASASGLRAEPRRDRRAILLGLRIATAALVWAVAVQPRWVAERFEVYACGVELANGFGELTDAEEQRRRFVLEMEEKQRLYGSGIRLTRSCWRPCR